MDVAVWAAGYQVKSDEFNATNSHLQKSHDSVRFSAGQAAIPCQGGGFHRAAAKMCVNPVYAALEMILFSSQACVTLPHTIAPSRMTARGARIPEELWGIISLAASMT
jgi:hypothetical protein